VAVPSAHEEGTLVSVHPSLQVVVPLGAYWKRAVATPDPESVAVPESVTSPRNGDRDR